MSAPFAPSQALIEAIQALVNAGVPSRSRNVVESHRDDLLSNGAAVVLKAEWQNRKEKGDEQAVCTFEQWLGLLASCRRIGIEATFAQDEALAQQEFALSILNLSGGAPIGMIGEEPYPFVIEAIRNAWPLLDAETQPITRAILATELAYGLSRTKAAADDDSAKAISDLENNIPTLTAARMLDRLCRAYYAIGALTLRRYQNSRAEGDLAAAIEAYQKAIAFVFARHNETLSEETLQLGVDAAHDALLAAPRGTHDWPRRSYQYGLALQLRFKARRNVSSLVTRGRTSGSEDMDQAIAAVRDAVAALPAGSLERSTYQSDLALLTWQRFDAFGNPQDLETAIDDLRQLQSLTDEKDPSWVPVTGQLGMALHSRFNITWQLDDLEESITSLRVAAVRSAAEGGTSLHWKNNLATALCTRFRALGEVADLDDAIEALAGVVKNTPPAEVLWPLAQYNLGIALIDRFDFRAEIRHIDAAIDALRAALQATPRNTLMWPDFNADLGVALRKRAEATGDTKGLDEAIHHLQAAISATPAKAGRQRWLANIGATFLVRYRASDDRSALDSSIDAYQRALADMPARSSDWARAYLDLALALTARFETMGAAGDFDAAVAAFKGSVADYTVEEWPDHILSASEGLGRLYFSQKLWRQAAETLSKGVRCMDLLYRQQLLATGREGWLAHGGDLYRLAAYALARSGDAGSALITLERGRARQLSDALARDHVDLEQVRVADPKLYELYRSASARLQSLTGATADMTSEMRDVARAARSDLDRATAHIRELLGNQQFLPEPGINDIRAAVTRRRPLVYIITTAAGSLALIASVGGAAGELQIDSIWCDTFKDRDLHRILLQGKGKTKGKGGYLMGQMAGPPLLDESLDLALELTRTRLMLPIARGLRLLKASGAVLFSGGHLALLPLHAALIDDFDIGYAPTTRALSGAARQSPAGPVIVGVGNPLPNPSPLEYARLEVAALSAFFVPERRYTLYETEADLSRVRENLHSATHIHFACHGIFDAGRPLESRLELAGGTSLTLRSLLEGHDLQNTRLVVMSACQTAVTDFLKLPDEAIGLPAGCLHAGAEAVVGTLWPVNDLSAAILMIEFYRLHIEQKQPVANALRTAQIWLRNLSRESLVQIVTRLRDDADRPLRNQLDVLRDRLIEELEPADTPFSAPAHWAPFVAVGRVHPEEVNDVAP